MKKYCFFSLLTLLTFTLSGCGDDAVEPTPNENTGGNNNGNAGNKDEDKDFDKEYQNTEKANEGIMMN